MASYKELHQQDAPSIARPSGDVDSMLAELTKSGIEIAVVSNKGAS